jgi:hypothetical protein
MQSGMVYIAIARDLSLNTEMSRTWAVASEYTLVRHILEVKRLTTDRVSL